MRVEGRRPSQARRSSRALTGHSAGLRVLTWTAGSARKCVGAGGEPDALTAHVRFWEGAVPNWRWSRYCDTTTGNQVATVKTNFDLRPRGTRASAHSA
jgi:hypothetical protein